MVSMEKAMMMPIRQTAGTGKDHLDEPNNTLLDNIHIIKRAGDH